MPCLNKFKKTIQAYRLLEKGNKVIVAVSGGPDSVALLYLLNSLKRQLNLTLHVAHLDHGLRGDSYKDKEFVEKLAQALKLEVTCGCAGLKKISEKGSSEEALRNMRFAFLFGLAKKIKADKIALGHNLDDQAETVLMRILRGSGLYGLSGISPKRDIRGYELIRPLIEIRRREIDAFLRKKKIKTRLDKTNLEDIYFRNRVRNKLLPSLEKEYNKNIKEVLSNMARICACDYDYLNKSALSAMKRVGKKINLAKFLKLHPAIQRLILRLNIVRLKGDARRITFKHIKEIEDLIQHRPVKSIVDLPQGISVIKMKKNLLFYNS